ncbi:hypothetical protein QOZ80_3BG0254550 [Eleusine coracana subsp. coracana]|nr:hypothetical protein QOZ80_3BG0254550 [Eleusine coracana subsp. coracana]
MTGPRGKRKTEASRTSDAPAQPKPEASRRSRRVAAAAAPPLECEAPAAWIARPSSPVFTRETMHLNLTHILRSGRKVLVADTSKPAPLQYKKGEEPVYDVSWQTPVCAKVALEHYNRLNEEDEHELVKAVDSVSFFFNGRWMHANFLAKSKGAKSCVDLVPKYFFAELKVGPDGKESCVSCIKMDPGNPQTRPVRGCKICPSRMFHPAAGGHRGVPVLHGAARGDQVETQAAPDLTA